jgi:hypothetical protein
MRPNRAQLTPESRRWRIGLLIGCALALLITYLSWFSCTPLLPWCATSNGFRVAYVPGAAAVYVTTVAPGDNADRAGLRVGDRINFSEIRFGERWRMRDAHRGDQLPRGQRLNLIAHRTNKTVALSFIPRAVSPDFGFLWDDWIGYLSSIWGIAFAAVLALRRPDLAQARLLSLMLIGYFGGLFAPGAPWAVAAFIGTFVGYTVFTSGTWVFFAAFTALIGRPLSPIRRLVTALTIGLAVLAAFMNIAWFVATFVFATATGPLDPLTDYALALGAFAMVGTGILAITGSRGAERGRATWATASVGPFFALQGVFNVVSPFLSNSARLATEDLLTPLLLIMPVGLTYAVLSRRCVDVGYLINRAAVFGAVSLVVLGAFVVAEWAMGSWLGSASHATTIVSLVVALALGLSIRFIHRRVDRIVDQLFFRKRHEDELALRHFAREAALITNLDTLVERTVTTATEHSEANSVNVLLRNGEATYASVGNGRVCSANENDPAILAMRTWHEPIDLHRFDTALEGERAFPMMARGRLLGVLVCGEKRNGEAFAPDESEALATVAHGVGTAIDLLGSKHNDSLERIAHAQEQLVEEFRSLKAELEGRHRDAKA